MDVDLLPRFKATPSCLSAWAVSQLVRGFAPEAVQLTAALHLKSCDICCSTLADARAELQTAAGLELPAALQHVARFRQPQWAWGARLVRAAVAVLFALIAVQGTTTFVAQRERSKGPASLDVVVVHSGGTAEPERPLETLSSARPGDLLGLRVVAAAPGSWVQLQGDEGSRRVTYFAGPLPPGGWMPRRLEVTPDGRTMLHLTVCEGGWARRWRHRCQESSFEFGVRMP